MHLPSTAFKKLTWPNLLMRVELQSYMIQLFLLKVCRIIITSYKLILKKENRFTSCESEDWKRTMLPFKHMFALFNEKTRLDWDAFSESYRNSAIFSIGIIKNNNIGTNVRGAEFDHSVENEIQGDNNHVNFTPLQKKQYSKKLLKHIKLINICYSRY